LHGKEKTIKKKLSTSGGRFSFMAGKPRAGLFWGPVKGGLRRPPFRPKGPGKGQQEQRKKKT